MSYAPTDNELGLEMSGDEGADDADDACWTKFADIASNARLANEVEFFMMKSGIKSGAASGGENGAEFTSAGGIEDTGLELASGDAAMVAATPLGERFFPFSRASSRHGNCFVICFPIAPGAEAPPQKLDSDGANKPTSLRAPSLPRVETLESAPSENERVLGLSCPAYQANWLRWSNDVLATQGDTPSDRTSSELVAGATAGLGGAEEAAPAFTPTGGPIGGTERESHSKLARR